MTLFSAIVKPIWSFSESWNDEPLRDIAVSAIGAVAEMAGVIEIGAGDCLNAAAVAQAFEISADAGAGQVQIGQKRFRSARQISADVELQTFRGARKGMLGLVEEVETFDEATIVFVGHGQHVGATTTGGSLIECRVSFALAISSTPPAIFRQSVVLAARLT